MLKVSIIIPAYNAAKFIQRCLLSAISQTYENIEYVLVDDCSDDNTVELIKHVFSKSKRYESLVLIEHKKNKGVAVARNTGLQNSSGDYIYFLDSDDELPEDAIESLILLNENQMADVIIGDFEVTGASRLKFGKLKLSEGLIKKNEFIFSSFLQMQWPDMTCNKLEKRKFLLKNGMKFKEGIVHEDALWGFELAMNAQSMIVSHKKTYTYHIQPISITRCKNERNFVSLLIVFSTIVSYIVEKELYKKNLPLLDYISNFRIYFYKELIKSEMPISYINEKIDEIQYVMYNLPKCKSKRSFISYLKEFPYWLPRPLGLLLVKLLVFLSR